VGRQRRQYSREFKLAALAQLKLGRSVAQVAREHDLTPGLLYDWQRILDENGEAAFAGNGNTYKEEARIAELERKVGQQALEIDFLRKVNDRLMKLDAEEKKRGRQP
jgi:transposase